MKTPAKAVEYLRAAAVAAQDWFESATEEKTKEVYLARGKLGDDGLGAVYAYFDLGGKALYIGQSKRGIKSRMHDVTSPHKKAKWWDSWTTMRFLRLPNQTDRLALELLLILAYSPTFNKGPGAREIAKIFSDAN